MAPGARHPLYRRMMGLLGTAVSRRAKTRIHRLAVPDTREARDISERVNRIDWYQAIELPHGVVTPGRADHRDQVSRYGLPEDMSGMRALDVATFDGFWAFEMERRGAEVVAIDIGRWSDADIPARWLEEMKPEQDAITGDGFRLARELLGSRVDRREINVYDLDPDQFGAFDVVMMSDLLLHIRDPQRALERLYEVTAPGGCAIIAEPYDQRLDRITNGLVIQLGGFETRVWSIPSSRALKFMVKLAGFDPVEELSRFRLNYDHPFAVQKVVLKGYRDESRVPRRVQVQAGSKNGR
jgi:tRNA (mo5U34)-methyltransferase